MGKKAELILLGLALIILIAPLNLVANPVVEDIVLEWESVGTVVNIDFIILLSSNHLDSNINHYLTPFLIKLLRQMCH